MKSLVGFFLLILSGNALAFPRGQADVTDTSLTSTMTSVTNLIGDKLEKYTPSLINKLYTSIQNITAQPNKAIYCSVPLVQKISYNTVSLTIDLVKILKDELYGVDQPDVSSAPMDSTEISKISAMESTTTKVLQILSRSLKPITFLMLKSIQGFQNYLQCIGFYTQ